MKAVFISLFVFVAELASAHAYPYWVHHAHYRIAGCGCEVKFIRGQDNGPVFTSGNLNIKGYNTHTGKVVVSLLKKIEHHQLNNSDMSFAEKCFEVMKSYSLCPR